VDEGFMEREREEEGDGLCVIDSELETRGTPFHEVK
jgi:hypothetical protein